MMDQKKWTPGRPSIEWLLFSRSFDGFFPNVDCQDQKSPLRKIYRVFFFLVMLVFSIPLLSNHVGAGETKIIPALSVGGAYDDNVLFSANEKVYSSIFTVSPRLDIKYNTDLSSLWFKADYDILTYLDESDLNRTNQYYRLSGDSQFKERWDTSVDIEYNKDTALNSYLQDVGRVIDRIERDFLDAGARVAYNLTQRSSLSARYRYLAARFEDDVYTDYDSHRVNLYYNLRLKSEVDQLSFGPSYYHRNNDLNEVDSFTLDVGWDRDWSSITNSFAGIGARYTKVKDNDGDDDDTWGAKARFEFTYQGEISTAEIRHFHDLRTTAEGDDVNVDNFFITYRRSVTERFGAAIDGRLVFSYKLLDRDSDINDSRYYWLEPRLFYLLTERLNLSLRYRYQNNFEKRDQGDVTRDRNIVWLELNYAHPILR